eukprot:TRINITY_DN9438_c0_g2_i1.p1 TRINITY_DN9438_c0_g2~~TRINITY_DN9438_c0_g2_i1.p1  ORF type:complete len:121 (-),score=24.00 TRINITY_DN9438_c0_g2_i1:38-355(-)
MSNLLASEYNNSDDVPTLRSAPVFVRPLQNSIGSSGHESVVEDGPVLFYFPQPHSYAGAPPAYDALQHRVPIGTAPSSNWLQVEVTPEDAAVLYAHCAEMLRYGC